ncbi:MAG: helix-turn-helix domain-containing protein [Planctomycetaceae bacterium]|jgi:excisionase family DNA binding protein|nr:helix-turn-helix domain-containing protein [Planctomycetaceae bacterium]
MSDREFLTLNEVADLLSLSTCTVRRLYPKGQMPKPLKIGRSLRWRKQLILDWCEQQEGEPIEESRRNFQPI